MALIQCHILLEHAPDPCDVYGLVPGGHQGQDVAGVVHALLKQGFEGLEGLPLTAGLAGFHSELVVAQSALPDKHLLRVPLLHRTPPHQRPHNRPHRVLPGPAEHNVGSVRVAGLQGVHCIHVAAPLCPVSGADHLGALGLLAREHALIHLIVVAVAVPEFLLDLLQKHRTEVVDADAQDRGLLHRANPGYRIGGNVGHDAHDRAS
mmetsp:Transcript_51231/g.112284  ORF Transcript_51231/g.112284 Transcript_51231/m.112284 type:complete len:206 (+) Transcript_51231:928-1545(+)